MKREKTQREFETTIEIGDDEIDVTVKYSFNPGFAGYNTHCGPLDGAQPPEPREVDEVYAVIRDSDKVDIIDSLSKEQLDKIKEEADDDMDNQDRDEADAYQAALEDKADAERERRILEDW